MQRVGCRRIERITQDHIPLGYITDIAEWTKWMFKPSPLARPTHIHMRLQGRANQRYPRLFRDYLRAHPPVAEAYAQVKQGLVAHQFHDQDAYYGVKDPVCDIIIGGAEA